MNPVLLGEKYDRIARWWHERHDASDYGTALLKKALGFAKQGGKALDVGCGPGGRMVRTLESGGFGVTGLDVSEAMILLARTHHPDHTFVHADIAAWESEERFDLIVAWDSIFHLPLALHDPVVTKLCRLLDAGGVLIYSFGNAVGEHTDVWHGDTFYYSSIGINANAQLLIREGMQLLHLELDRFPDLRHAVVIARKHPSGEGITA